MQRAFDRNESLHVANITDGNGPWAGAQGLPRAAGHRAGVEAIRRVSEAAPQLEITTLRPAAFSADNWRLPHIEVGALMQLLLHYLSTEIARRIEAMETFVNDARSRGLQLYTKIYII